MAPRYLAPTAPRPCTNLHHLNENSIYTYASQYVPIYLQPFLRYSELLVENCDIFTPHLCLAAPQTVIPLEFREDLDIHRTRMNGLSCGEETMTICSAVLIQYQSVTDRRTDVQLISTTCFSIADARKNESNYYFLKFKF